MIKRINKRMIRITLHQYMRHLDETGKFLEGHKTPKLTQDGMNNVNNPISVKEIECPNSKIWAQMTTLMNSTRHFRNS